MAKVQLDITEFRALFTPQFDDATKYPGAKINLVWETKIECYMNIDLSCSRFSAGCLKTLSYLLLAHLLLMDFKNNNDGGRVAREVKSATEGSVSVTFESVNSNPASTQALDFFNQTSYGREFLAMKEQRRPPAYVVCSRRKTQRPSF